MNHQESLRRLRKLHDAIDDVTSASGKCNRLKGAPLLYSPEEIELVSILAKTCAATSRAAGSDWLKPILREINWPNDGIWFNNIHDRLKAGSIDVYDSNKRVEFYHWLSAFYHDIVLIAQRLGLDLDEKSIQSPDSQCGLDLQEKSVSPDAQLKSAPIENIVSDKVSDSVQLQIRRSLKKRNAVEKKNRLTKHQLKRPQKKRRRRKQQKAIKPVWSRKDRELKLGDKTIKKWKKEAKNQFAILDAFQKADWIATVKPELKGKALGDTIEHMKKKIPELNFHRDGTAIGVGWSIKTKQREITLENQ